MKKSAIVLLYCLILLSARGEDTIPSSISLSEITVKAERFIRTDDGLSIIPGRKQAQHATSGYDLIYNLMIPGLSVNISKGEINALGGSVSVYIDGMPADQREVRQLRPADVLRVQYMDAPTGKYAGNNAVINFVMKKRNSGGYVAMDGLQRIGYGQGDYNLSGKTFHGNTQVTVFTGADWLDASGAKTTRNEEIFFPGHVINRDYITDASATRNNSQYAQLRLRNKTDRRTLRATFSFVRDATPKDFLSSLLTYTGIEPTPKSIPASKYSTSRSYKYNLGLSGNFTVADNQFVEASAYATFIRNHFGYTYSEASSRVLSASRENYYNFGANFTYGIKFEHGNTLTFKATETYNVSSALYTGASVSWQHLWSSETICFSEYMHQLWGKAQVRVAPGFSMQQYRLHGYDRVSRVGARMQLAFTMQPARKQFMQILAFYGNSYPQLSMMSSASQQVDMIELKRGNPNLKQTEMARVMLAYGVGFGDFNLQTLGIYNGAWHLPMAGFSFENDMLVGSWLPDGVWRQYDATISATWTPTAVFNLQGSAGYLYNGYTKAAVVSAGCWKAGLNANCYIGSFSIQGHVETPLKIAGGDRTVTRTPWLYGIAATWRHKALFVEVGTENPFSSRPQYKTILSTPQIGFVNISQSSTDRCNAYVKLSWSIDYGKKTSRDTRNIDRTISTGVIRPD